MVKNTAQQGRAQLVNTGSIHPLTALGNTVVPIIALGTRYGLQEHAVQQTQSKRRWQGGLKEGNMTEGHGIPSNAGSNRDCCDHHRRRIFYRGKIGLKTLEISIDEPGRLTGVVATKKSQRFIVTQDAVGSQINTGIQRIDHIHRRRGRAPFCRGGRYRIGARLIDGQRGSYGTVTPNKIHGTARPASIHRLND